MKEFKAAVVDDDPNLRELLLECLRFTDFEADGYEEAEHLLQTLAFSSPQEMPDLILIDLRLQPLRMQGLELISQLAERDIPSEVVAMSGADPTSDLVEAIKIGASAMVTKPFDDIFRLMVKLRNMAEIGKKRRLKLSGFDHERQERPVFLSYCAEDVKLATGLRRNIEAHDIDVWYAPTTLNAGDEWRPRVESGIDHALAFIPLITDNYLSSPICFGELVRFRRRLEPDSGLCPLLLPVLAGLSEDGKRNSLLRPLLDHYQHIDLFVRFIDSLTTLLGRIEFHIIKSSKAPFAGRGQNGTPESGASKTQVVTV
ncbi:MAG: response regulator [Pyrinomonadaceae bacterium]